MWWAPRMALAAAVLVALGPLGTRAGWWRFPLGLGFVALGSLVALLAILIAAVAGVRSRDWGSAGIAVALGLVVAAVPLSQLLRSGRVPPIHDISTDLDDPPAFIAVLPLRTGTVSPAAYDGPEVAAQQRASYADIQPIQVAAPVGEAFRRSLEAARALGWTVVASDAAGGRIEATDTTYWFRFVDDVVVRVRPTGDGSRIDVRSKSRLGRGDLGANARRIRAFNARVTAR